MKVATGCVVWIAFIAVAIVVVSLTGCAAPEVDSYDAAFLAMPKPTNCSAGNDGRPCQQWIEPGLMVKK